MFTLAQQHILVIQTPYHPPPPKSNNPIHPPLINQPFSFFGPGIYNVSRQPARNRTGKARAMYKGDMTHDEAFDETHFEPPSKRDVAILHLTHYLTREVGFIIGDENSQTDEILMEKTIVAMVDVVLNALDSYDIREAILGSDFFK